MQISEPWPHICMSLVHHLCFFGPFLVATNHCILGTPTRPDTLKMFSHHSVALLKVPEILKARQFFLALNISTLEINVIDEIINVLAFLHFRYLKFILHNSSAASCRLELHCFGQVTSTYHYTFCIKLRLQNCFISYAISGISLPVLWAACVLYQPDLLQHSEQKGPDTRQG